MKEPPNPPTIHKLETLEPQGAKPQEGTNKTMSCCACCKNPGYQRVNRWILLALNLITWSFSIATLTSCNFMTHKDYYDDRDGIGIFRFESSARGCVSWDTLSEGGNNYKYETPHKISRAFGVIACLLLGLSLIGISLVIFILKGKVSKIVWTVVRVLYIVALLCVLATFSFVGAFADDLCKADTYNDRARRSILKRDGEEDGRRESTCSLGAGGVVTALNVWFLFGMICVCWCVPVPENPVLCSGGCGGGGCCDDNGAATPGAFKQQPAAPPAANPMAYQQQPASARPASVSTQPTTTQTIEETSEGRKITTETVHPDGTVTVEETIEEGFAQ